MTFLLLAIICIAGFYFTGIKLMNPIAGGCFGLLIMFFLFAGCTSLLYDKATDDECEYEYATEYC